MVVRSTAGLAPRFESQYPYSGVHLLGHQACEWYKSLIRKKIISLQSYFQKETKINTPLLCVLSKYQSPTIHCSALDLPLVPLLLVKGAQRGPLPLPIHLERLTHNSGPRTIQAE